MNTSDLSGAALDYVVAECEGVIYHGPAWTKYSSEWSQGGPIIERERIELKYLGYGNPPYWGALKFSPSKYERKAAIGPTPLIAAMRCYVASKLGDTVNLPEELQ